MCLMVVKLSTALSQVKVGNYTKAKHWYAFLKNTKEKWIYMISSYIHPRLSMVLIVLWSVPCLLISANRQLPQLLWFNNYVGAVISLISILCSNRCQFVLINTTTLTRLKTRWRHFINYLYPLSIVLKVTLKMITWIYIQGFNTIMIAMTPIKRHILWQSLKIVG